MSKLGPRTLLPLALLVLGLVVAGCGDDGDGEAKSGTTFTVAPSGAITTRTTVRPLRPEEIDPEASPYCATWLELRSQGGPKVGGLDEEGEAARYREYYGELLPIVDRLVEQAPDEIREAAEGARERTTEAATAGSFDPFRTEEARQGTAALAQYALDNCARK